MIVYFLVMNSKRCTIPHCYVCGSKDAPFRHPNLRSLGSLCLTGKNVLILHILVFYHIFSNLVILHPFLILKFYLLALPILIF